MKKRHQGATAWSSPTHRALAKETRNKTLRVRYRKEQEERGSKGGPRSRDSTRERSHGGTREEGRGRSMQEGAKQIMKDRVRGNVRENETKNSTEHRTVGSNRRV